MNTAPTQHRPPNEERGKLLRGLREARGLSQVALAFRSGVSLSTLSVAERTGFLTPTTAQRLATALEVNPEAFQ
jgi:transcriptional regulator with XRE-family HTH domain